MNLSFKSTNREFSGALKKKVEAYFSTQKNTAGTGNVHLYLKTAILLTTGGLLYFFILWGGIPVWATLALCVAFGFSLAAIGFNVMHDGAHGSYSRKKWINEIMAYSLNLMGGSTFLWRQKHNVNHHTYTNIEGHDDDIDIRPMMRTNSNQPKHSFHRYQHIYWVLLYGFGYLSWVFGKNFKEYFTGKVGVKKMKKMSTKEHFIFWISKLVYFGIFIAVPIFVAGFWQAIVGYLVVALACGFVLSIVFQLAHVVESTSFSATAAEETRVNQEWTIHQINTTANFATRNKFISWFMGGLNFQVEHHLFPKISHVHYPAISRLVKETCAEFNIQYNEYSSMFKAIKSHVLHLKLVGRE